MAKHGPQSFERPVILAIELASMCGSIALVAKNACISEHSLHTSQTHSKRLIPQIERIIGDSGLTWPELDAIAVSLGPGSFTGLRIALSTVKGLAMAFSCKLLGIPTLDGLASQIQHSPHLICPIMDARKKEVYTAFYRCNSSGKPEAISKNMVISAATLAEQIKEKTIFLGDGVSIYKEYLADKLNNLACFAPPLINFTRASAIGMLAQDKFQEKSFLDPSKVTPLYVRASDAEIQLKEKDEHRTSN